MAWQTISRESKHAIKLFAKWTATPLKLNCRFSVWRARAAQAPPARTVEAARDVGTLAGTINQPGTLHGVIVNCRLAGFGITLCQRIESGAAAFTFGIHLTVWGHGREPLSSAYIRKLLTNVRVARLLKASHPSICAECEKFASTQAF